MQQVLLCCLESLLVAHCALPCVLHSKIRFVTKLNVYLLPSQVYRACRDCLKLGLNPKSILPHCPRSNCNGINVRMGKRGCHETGTALDAHFVVVENDQFAIKFRKRRVKAKNARAK